MFHEQFIYLTKTVFGTQLLIPTLNSSRHLVFFTSAGTLSCSFGPIEDAVSMRYISVHGMLQLHLDWFRLWGTSLNSKTPFTNSGAIPVLTLNISVISSCRFRWCKVVELSLLSSASKNESKSLYTTCKALSWSLLMRAFSLRLWQYEKWQITKEFSFAQNSLMMQVLTKHWFFDLLLYQKSL